MDQVLYWNDVALEANRVSLTDKDKNEQGGPTLGSRAFGIIHLAMHDAYKGASGTTGFNAYLGAMLPAPPPAGAASIDAAIAGAAHSALVALYPRQKAFFDVKLNTIPHILSGKEVGYQYGCMVAKALIDKRRNDPDNSDKGYMAHVGKGKHKPDPDNVQGFLAPFYGAKSNLFAATVRHELTEPPFYSNPATYTYSDDYKRSLKNVKNKGIAPELMGTLPNNANKRTVDESLIGVVWAYDGANSIGTPPKLYNQIIRTLAINNPDLRGYANLLERNVRLFAFVNAAMADAGILAWDQKYKHNFWRPVNGIREHDKSMGPTGIANNNIDDDCDPMWLPLGAPRSNVDGSKNFTPDFPAYPSGHATFGAAALHIARLFFGVTGHANDTLFNGLDFISDEFNGVTKDNAGATRPCHVRSFPGGLWQMIVENGLSRVYLGVHWSFDAFKTEKDNKTPIIGQQVGGVDLGLTIAEDIFASNLSMSTVGPRP